jgi:hypothetical protein
VCWGSDSGGGPVMSFMLASPIIALEAVGGHLFAGKPGVLLTCRSDFGSFLSADGGDGARAADGPAAVPAHDGVYRRDHLPGDRRLGPERVDGGEERAGHGRRGVVGQGERWDRGLLHGSQVLGMSLALRLAMGLVPDRDVVQPEEEVG